MRRRWWRELLELVGLVLLIALALTPAAVLLWLLAGV